MDTPTEPSGPDLEPASLRVPRIAAAIGLIVAFVLVGVGFSVSVWLGILAVAAVPAVPMLAVLAADSITR
ncbi:MAG: hypothetical protein R2695_13360 [Acidimicrobiales bacterium]